MPALMPAVPPTELWDVPPDTALDVVCHRPPTQNK